MHQACVCVLYSWLDYQVIQTRVVNRSEFRFNCFRGNNTRTSMSSFTLNNRVLEGKGKDTETAEVINRNENQYKSYKYSKKVKITTRTEKRSQFDSFNVRLIYLIVRGRHHNGFQGPPQDKQTISRKAKAVAS